jgi:hypothetical protein
MSAPHRLSKFENRPDTLENDDMVCEPVSGLKPVYWESLGRIVGPGQVSAVAKVGEEFWLSVEYAGSWLWINESVLRTQREFEEQDKPRCHCCGGTDLWASVHDVSMCRRCHPPAASSLVKGHKDTA